MIYLNRSGCLRLLDAIKSQAQHDHEYAQKNQKQFHRYKGNHTNFYECVSAQSDFNMTFNNNLENLALVTSDMMRRKRHHHHKIQLLPRIERPELMRDSDMADRCYKSIRAKNWYYLT